MRKASVLPTGAHDGHLLLKFDERFENSFGTVQRGETRLDIGGRFFFGLSFAVVSKPGGFQNRRRSDFLDRVIEILDQRDLSERRDRVSVGGEKSFFAKSILSR